MGGWSGTNSARLPTSWVVALRVEQFAVLRRTICWQPPRLVSEDLWTTEEHRDPKPREKGAPRVCTDRFQFLWCQEQN